MNASQPDVGLGMEDNNGMLCPAGHDLRLPLRLSVTLNFHSCPLVRIDFTLALRQILIQLTGLKFCGCGHAPRHAARLYYAPTSSHGFQDDPIGNLVWLKDDAVGLVAASLMEASRSTIAALPELPPSELGHRRVNDMRFVASLPEPVGNDPVRRKIDWSNPITLSNSVVVICICSRLMFTQRA